MEKSKSTSSKPLQQNWLGEWAEVPETEPLGRYTQVLRQQEAEAQSTLLLARIETLKSE